MACKQEHAFPNYFQFASMLFVSSTQWSWTMLRMLSEYQFNFVLLPLA